MNWISFLAVFLASVSLGVSVSYLFVQNRFNEETLKFMRTTVDTLKKMNHV